MMGIIFITISSGFLFVNLNKIGRISPYAIVGFV